MSVVNVTPGATYTINVGAGGAPGGRGEAGADGGDTTFVDSSGNVLVGAGGGQGGQALGAPGAGGQPIGSPMIGRPGQTAVAYNDTQGWLVPTLTPANLGGSGGGTGGAGATRQPPFGSAGVAGYAFIAW